MDEPQKLGSNLNNNSAPLLGEDHNANLGHGGGGMPPKAGEPSAPFMVSPKPPMTPPNPTVPSSPVPAPKVFSGLPSFAPTGAQPRGANVPPPPPPPSPLPPPPPMSGHSPVSLSNKPLTPPAIPSRPANPIESKTPAPQAPSVNIRSMTSDAQTLKQSGGIAPKPQTIRLETLEDIAPVPAPVTNNQLPEGVVRNGGRKFKIIFEVVLVFALAGILGFAGYYYAYPFIFGDKSEEVPVVPKEEKPAVKEVKPESAASLIHKSFFIQPIVEQASVSFSDLTAVDIITALQVEARRVLVAGTLKELSLKKGGVQVDFSQYFNALLPNIGIAEVEAVAEKDFTGFMYYDAKGVWPGYIAHIKKGALPAELANLISKFENADLSRLYVADPGLGEGFKNGPYKDVAVRYAKFANPGASLNYGIFGEFLVISTSFNGLKASVEALGL